jgi:hypothetical protein
MYASPFSVLKFGEQKAFGRKKKLLANRNDEVKEKPVKNCTFLVRSLFIYSSFQFLLSLSKYHRTGEADEQESAV